MIVDQLAYRYLPASNWRKKKVATKVTAVDTSLSESSDQYTDESTKEAASKALLSTRDSEHLFLSPDHGFLTGHKVRIRKVQHATKENVNFQERVGLIVDILA